MANSLENIKRAPIEKSSSTAPLSKPDLLKDKLPLELVLDICSYLKPAAAQTVKQLNSHYRSIIEDSTQTRFTKATSQLLEVLKPHLPQDHYDDLKNCAEAFQEGAKSVYATPLNQVRFYNTKEARDSFRRLLIQYLTMSLAAQTALASNPGLVLPYEFNHIAELTQVLTKYHQIKSNPMMNVMNLKAYIELAPSFGKLPPICIKDLALLEPQTTIDLLLYLKIKNAPLALELTQHLPSTEMKEVIFCAHITSLTNNERLNEALDFLSNHINNLETRCRMIKMIGLEVTSRHNVQPNATIDSLIDSVHPYFASLPLNPDEAHNIKLLDDFCHALIRMGYLNKALEFASYSHNPKARSSMLEYSLT